MCFDCPVYGLFDRALKVARRQAGVFACLRGRRKAPNLSLVFQPAKDPEVSSSLSVLGAYCREVWNAGLHPVYRDASGLTLGTLARGVQGYLDNNKNPPFSFNKRINGPISALHRTLYAAGWALASPFNLINKQGESLHLLTKCPTAIVKAFRKDLVSTIAHRDIVALHMRHDTVETRELVDRGLFLQPLVALYSSLSSHDACLLHNIVNNGIFTNTDLADSGYDIDPVCGLCEQALDTIYHRCYSCTHIETRAKTALGIDLYDKIIAAGPNSLLATRCMAPSPILTEGPSKDLLFDVVNFGEGDVMGPQGGKVYGDGSCFFPAFSPLARAGFAIVQVAPDGSLLRAIYGCMPSTLPQTSLAGEYGALSCAYDNSRGVVFVGDCQDVISNQQGGFKGALTNKGTHACIWKRLLMRYTDCPDRILSSLKTKAHRALDEVSDSPDDLRDYYGNLEADKWAKEGAKLHYPPLCDIQAFTQARKEVQNLARHMVDVLSTLRLSRIDIARAPLLPNNSRPVIQRKPNMGHEFRWQGGMWVCLKCLLRSSSSSSHSNAPCRRIPAINAIFSKDNGHKLHTSPLLGGGQIIYCSSCWCYASAYPRKLLEPCVRPPLGFRPCARFHLVNRRHPRSRARLLHPIRLHVN